MNDTSGAERKQNAKKKKWDIKKVLTVVLLAVVVVLLLSGKLSLNDLLGIASGNDPGQATDSGEILIPTEKPSETGETEKPTKASEKPTKETEKPTKASEKETKQSTAAYVTYRFRSKNLLNQHYDKHGKDMGFASASAYEKAASDVINNPKALHKTEKEDGDFCYYVEATNEFVVLSVDGYIRTYFLPDSGKKYYDKQ